MDESCCLNFGCGHGEVDADSVGTLVFGEGEDGCYDFVCCCGEYVGE